MTKTVEQTYRVLDEISHIRHRTGMYAGSVVEQTSNEWVFDGTKMVREDVTYTPALVKIFSEILDNAVDEHKRAPEVLDAIRITFSDKGEITITDNGRGIPVEIHPDTGQYVAETVFTNLRAGSNFDDSVDQALGGTNGVGSTICVILSKEFYVESCDGKKVYKQTFSDGLRKKSEPVIKEDTKNRTKISFTPDYEFFKLPGLTDGNKRRMMKRIVDAAACNPKVKFYIDGNRISIKDFQDYVSLFDPVNVVDITGDWSVGVSASDGFEQISFVNALETYQGGTHVDYVTNQIVSKVRDAIKKKNKIEVKPSDIKAHMRVYISAKINRPRFSSQTKENMLSAVSDYKTSWTVTDKMIKKILQSSIIQSILDWAEAKAKAQELKDLRDLNKSAAKTKPRRVEKFEDAVEKNDRHLCMLTLNEGDSSRASIQAARGKNKYIGSFSLRGKPLNVYDAELKEVIANNEFANVMAVTGLQLGEPVIPEEDGAWHLIEKDGIEMLINENDWVIDNGKQVQIKSLL